MSDLELHPVEHVLECGEEHLDCPEVLEPREVPLGGPRAMPVLRSLPNRPRRMIGAWCFADAYGPIPIGDGPGMAVPPHPHTGLQTVSWIVAGAVEHRDSLGSHAIVRPGGVGLMTAGAGISHSEYSRADGGPVLHGAQLWIALPKHEWARPPAFEGLAELPTRRFTAGDPVADDLGPGVSGVVGDADAALDATVLVGAFAGLDAGTTVHAPLVGVGLRASGCLEASLALDPAFEHGVLALGEGVAVDDVPVPVGGIVYLAPGTSAAVIATSGVADAVLIGGTPFDDEIVMFWNFVAPSHDDVVEARTEWQAEREHGGDLAARSRFGIVGDDPHRSLPAPDLPGVHLRPRGRHQENETGGVREAGAAD